MAHQPPESRTSAARIAGVATNVLATGLILMLGVVGGQHALRWWSAARSLGSADPLSADPLADVIGPAAVQGSRAPDRAVGEPARHLLAFGDYPLLAVRTELQGDTQDVLARLRDDCRSMAERTHRVQRTPGPAEQRMLTRIRLLEPIESTSRWRMYQIDSPLPLVVTVLDQPARGAAASDRNIAAVESRVVSWGLAFPALSDENASGGRWSLFTLTADNPQLGAIAIDRACPVPPQSRRTMSLRAESGAVMVGFQGTGSVRAWQTFYDRELAVPKWTPISGWRHDGSTWQRSFTSPLDGRLDVQLSEAADGSLDGLLMAAPPPGGATEK